MATRTRRTATRRSVSPPTRTLDNGTIAELLARESETTKPPLQRALRRAARRAFLWPVEANDLLRDGRSLTELSGIGPHLERLILGWMKERTSTPRPPDIRSGFLTLTKARAVLSGNPEWARRINGDLQMHTEWSDGAGSVEEMAMAGEQLGYAYVSITDHAQGLRIAGGMDEDELEAQGLEIERVNAVLAARGSTLRVLRSIELNLNPKGEGDMPARSLAGLDVVLGCFHSSLRTREDQTERYLAALRNPAIQILGHPRGRIYNHRVGLSADWDRIFAVAAELDKALEIDAYPDRQDLNVNLVRRTARAGCRISIGTDAHGASQLGFMEFGLAAALEGGVREDRILNFMTRENLLAWANAVRHA